MSRYPKGKCLKGHDLTEEGATYKGGQCKVCATERNRAKSPHRVPLIEPMVLPRIPVPEMWDYAERLTDSDVARHQTERLIKITIDDDRPIGLSFASDQHIRTSGPTMLRRMREDAELSCATDGLYTLLGGDGVDNHIKHRSAMVGGGSKVSDEWRLYDHYLSLFGPDKILAMISGNHDDWTRDEAGVDMVAQLAQRNSVHYCPDEAVISLQLPGHTYTIKLRHQYRYNSSFNLTHTVKQMYAMGGDQFDIGVVCHNHEPEIGNFTRHGLSRWAARPGSYQVNSSHGRRYGWNNTEPTCPTFLLFPRSRRIIGFQDIRDATGYLTYEREKAATP